MTPKPILVIGNNLIFEAINGIMLDDNLNLESQIDKEKAFKIVAKSLQKLRKIHQNSHQITHKISQNEDKIQKLNLKNWSNQTLEINLKIAKIKTKNLKIGQILAENWQKLSESCQNQAQNEIGFCHGDFSLSHIYYQKLENLANLEKNLEFIGIIDFGDAVLANPYLDISHLILKEINKSFGFEFGKFVLETYFENETIDFDLLTYFATFYTITRLCEFQNNEKLFAKFAEKYQKFLEFVDLKSSSKYLAFHFDGVLLDGFFSDIATDINCDK